MIALHEGAYSNFKTFNAFLCHNSEDKLQIRKIADDLIKKGHKPWLDEREKQPGKVWQTVLEEQIQSIRSVAALGGNGGINPWLVALKSKDNAQDHPVTGPSTCLWSQDVPR